MNDVLIPIVTALAGLLIGNRLSIGRDKRKEYNKLVDPMRLQIIKSIENKRPRYLNLDQISIIRNGMPNRKSLKFKKECEIYNSLFEKSQEQNSIGEVIWNTCNDHLFELHGNNILKIIKRL